MKVKVLMTSWLVLILISIVLVGAFIEGLEVWQQWSPFKSGFGAVLLVGVSHYLTWKVCEIRTRERRGKGERD